VKFVYYWMKANEQDLMRQTYGGSMPKINKKYLWDHPVPVPPMKVQEQIVEILDRFSDLVESTEIGLPAELTARRQQYEYYRNKLLTFKELKAS
jgi:type I restriction enzyme S subunit